MADALTHPDDRRKSERVEPEDVIRINRAASALPLEGIEVLNISDEGIALQSVMPFELGERLSFHTRGCPSPALGEVLSCKKHDEQNWLIRCRCLLGGFVSKG